MIIYEAAYIYYSFSGKHKFMTAYQDFCRYTAEKKYVRYLFFRVTKY